MKNLYHDQQRCDGVKCPHKQDCARFTTTNPEDRLVSNIEAKEILAKEGGCDMFTDNERKEKG